MVGFMDGGRLAIEPVDGLVEVFDQDGFAFLVVWEGPRWKGVRM